MSARKHILVVEDDIDIAQMLLLLFDMEGYSASMVRTGADALKLLLPCMDASIAGATMVEAVPELCPDLILLDLQLPDMNGEEIIHRLSNISLAAPPVIVLTARRQQAAEEVALEIDAAGMFLKPFEIQSLLDQIELVLARTA
ncbi:MAG TPA: response regulator [Herpetosiphonaceae bacterium]